MFVLPRDWPALPLPSPSPIYPGSGRRISDAVVPLSLSLPPLWWQNIMGL